MHIQLCGMSLMKWLLNMSIVHRKTQYQRDLLDWNYSNNMIFSAQAQHTVWCSRPCLTYFDITTHNPLCLHVCMCVWGGPVLKLICLSLFCRHIIPLFWNICSLCLSLYHYQLRYPIHSSHFCLSGPRFSSNTIALMLRCLDKETILNTHIHTQTQTESQRVKLERPLAVCWNTLHLLDCKGRGNALWFNLVTETE